MKKIVYLLFLLSLYSPAYADWDAQPVFIVPNSSVATSDTVRITTADTEQKLPNVGPITSVLLKAKHTNTERILISGTSDTSILKFSLATRDSISLSVDDLSDIYIRSNKVGEQLEYFCLR